MSDEEDVGYESGPFCVHYSDPIDCEDLCVCGHKCRQHPHGEDCNERACKEFKDA